jgi:hypothetical protein
MKTVYITIIALAVLFFASHQVRGMNGKMEKQMNKKPQESRTAVFAGGCL